MIELINIKIRAAISILSLTGSWVIAQATPVLDTAFDQLFSLGLLVVAVVVIWKAFTKKDESETALLKEHISLLQQEKDLQKSHISTLRDRIDDLQKKVDSHESCPDCNEPRMKR